MKIKNNFLLREIAGSYVVVPFGDESVEFNGMVTLNESGKFIWDLLEKEISKEELLEKFMAEYDVSEKQAKEDIRQFIQTLLDNNIMEL